MRAALAGLLITSLFCAACSDEHRPAVSPAAAKSAIERRASEWSARGEIVNLSCRADSADATALSCDGDPLECVEGQAPGGGAPSKTDRWLVHRGANGKPVVGDPQQITYCIVISPPDTVKECQSHPYLNCDATDP